MKKLLLLVAAATMALGATAATPKIATQAKSHDAVKELKAQGVIGSNLKDYVKLNDAVASGAMRAKSAVTPEGDPVQYVFSDYYYSAVPVMGSKSADGSKIYFDNMFVYIFNNGQAWVQGNISTDGTSVTFPGDIAIAELTAEGVSYPVYPVELITDEEGNVTDVKDLVFVKDGEKIYIEDDPDAPTRTLALCALDEDGSFLGYFDYTYVMAYEPYTGRTDLVELPEGAQPEDYIYQSYVAGLFGASLAIEQGLVYINGSDVYMNLLTSGYGEAWVKGTIDGNKATFPGDQYVDCGNFLVFQPFYTDGTTDEEGYLYTYPCDLVLNYDAEKNVFTMAEEEGKDLYNGLFTQDGGLYTYSFDLLIGKPTDAAATPTDPYNLEMEWDEDYGQYALFYNLDPISTEGDFLNLNNLAYYIYLDGEQYTLTPDVFSRLTEEMDLIPFTFTDGWDISTGYFYVAEPLATSLGIQAVYTVGEVVNYSNVVSVDVEGNVTTEPAPQVVPDGISNVTAKQVSGVEIYDVQGRKLSAPQQGVNIVKLVAADGSSKAVKMYKK
jgi:hypothetical protein